MVIPLIIGCGAASLGAALYFNARVQAVSIDQGAASPEESERLHKISNAIREGAMAFLFREYRTLAVFIALFSVVITLCVENPNTPEKEGLLSAVAFVIGAVISILAGFIGMRTATAGNVRTAVSARESLEKGFVTAINAGAVMGFGLSGLAVLGMLGVYLGLKAHLGPEHQHTIMEILSGFGLGGSSVALFARVGGGIYTKAADVGADLVGKVEAGIPEDDPRNPAVIADNVGDNVGDVAGMGADLFGSVAESTCAAMVIGAIAFGTTDLNALLYPLAISCLGIPASFVAILAFKAKSESEVQGALKNMLMLATVLMAILGYFVTMKLLPPEIHFKGMSHPVSPMDVYWAFASGLISGFLIGFLTEYYTSHSYGPTREVAKASTTGTATNIIYGLALGYNSAVIPSLLLAVTLVIAVSKAGMYGIALAAIGMLGTISVALTIDAYGPVADNAGGLAEMAHMGADIRKRTDVLDAAGNTTAAVGKGFAIGSAALTALALFSAYVTQCKELSATLGIKAMPDQLDLLDPWVMAGLMVGGALTCAFSAMTMRSVGLAALDMIEEVRRQFKTIPGLMEGTATADYARCVDIATQASLREMLRPGLMVVFTPILVGWLFGAKTLAGVLIGALITAVIFAISMANSGGSWDNAKKYIETGELGGRGTEAHKAAVVGDTVGDPFKDTSGPALNILIKLMAIISLVFAPFVVKHGGVVSKMFGE